MDRHETPRVRLIGRTNSLEIHVDRAPIELVIGGRAVILDPGLINTVALDLSMKLDVDQWLFSAADNFPEDELLGPEFRPLSDEEGLDG